MHIPLTPNNAELVTRAESGEDIVLTRDGRPVARHQPISRPKIIEEKRAFLLALQESATGKATAGLDAARSRDFL